MRALVLNGSKSEDNVGNRVSDYLVDILRMSGHQVDLIATCEEEIASCLGCFGCWLKTPGVCVIDDAGRDLPRRVVQSDLLFLVTPIVFGMYSPELKKAMDRYACPLLLPFFTKIKGEIHHLKRYDSYPKITAIGILPSPDAESETTFRDLASRNSLNMYNTAVARIIYSSDESSLIRDKLGKVLSEVGAI
jgi:multimeric flavodoxin WrbA